MQWSPLLSEKGPLSLEAPQPLPNPLGHRLPAALKRSWFSRDLAVNTSPTLAKWDSEGLILNGRPLPGA